MSSKNALVIGISEYEAGDPLLHPAKDAKDVATALREIGFAVMLEVNPNIKEFEDAIRFFAESIRYNKEAAIFYYSGHGLQIGGENYLVPRDAELDAEYRLKRQTIPLNEILDEMREARNSVNIVILDACRNNPFYKTTKSANKGLAGITNSPEGTILAYATSPGEVAFDGADGRENGVYTGELLKAIRTPGITIESMFKSVRQNVKKVTKNKQIPWETSSLTEDFYFIAPVKQPEKPMFDPVQAEEKYKSLLKAVYEDLSVTEEERESLVEKRVELGLSPARARELEAEFRKKASELKKEQAGTVSNAEKLAEEKKRLDEEQKLREEAEKKRLEEEQVKKLAEEKTKQELLEKQKQAEIKQREEAQRREVELEEKRLEEVRQKKEKETIPSNYGEELPNKPNADNRSNSTKGNFIGVAVILILAIGGWFGLKKSSAISNENSTPEIAAIKKVELPKEITDTNGIDFVLIPAGEFLMGCRGSIEANGEIKYTDKACGNDEKPLHKVKITKPFYLGKYEVTQAQWKAIMGYNPSEFSRCGLDCPVERMTWRDTQRFIKKMNEKIGQELYRLPTEAEWEYAARGGTNSVYFWGDDSKLYNDYMWNFLNTGNSNKSTHPVGKKKPNPFGLYDILGNVSEYVQDSSSEDYYSKSPEIDPKGFDSGEMRFMRGSNINDELDRARSSFRFHASSVDAYYAWGFRLLLEISDDKTFYNNLSKVTPQSEETPNGSSELQKQNHSGQQRLADQKKAEEIRREAELAEQRRQQAIIEQYKKDCESGSGVWDGSKCVKKPVQQQGADTGKWSSFQGRMNWDEATARCASIGMRLPTITELKNASASGITRSWEIDGWNFWSSTSNGEGHSFNFNIDTNVVHDGKHSDITQVRCIR